MKSGHKILPFSTIGSCVQYSFDNLVLFNFHQGDLLHARPASNLLTAVRAGVDHIFATIYTKWNQTTAKSTSGKEFEHS